MFASDGRFVLARDRGDDASAHRLAELDGGEANAPGSAEDE